MKRSPCEKNCPRRNETCHSICPEYVKWRKERDAELEQINKIKATDGAVSEVISGYGERSYWKVRK